MTIARKTAPRNLSVPPSDDIAHRLRTAQRDELHRILVHLEHCHSAAACWKAGLPAR
jgi:hypothetical protein